MYIYSGTHYVGPGSGDHAVGPLWLVTLTSYNEGACGAHRSGAHVVGPVVDYITNRIPVNNAFHTLN